MAAGNAPGGHVLPLCVPPAANAGDEGQRYEVGFGISEVDGMMLEKRL